MLSACCRRSCCRRRRPCRLSSDTLRRRDRFSERSLPPVPAGGPDPDPGPGLASAAPPDAARERFFCGRHEGAPVPAERHRGMRLRLERGRLLRDEEFTREMRRFPTFRFLHTQFPVPGTHFLPDSYPLCSFQLRNSFFQLFFEGEGAPTTCGALLHHTGPKE